MLELIQKEKLFNKVCLGGTFDHLHKGHQNLLRTAFRMGNHISIGLTIDSLIKHKKHHSKIQSYKDRKRNLEIFIKNELLQSENSFIIDPLNDPFGTTISDPRLNAIVCSQETYRVCIKINEIRIRKGLKPIIIIIIPLTLNSSGKKLSSSDIRAGLIQENKKKRLNLLIKESCEV